MDPNLFDCLQTTALRKYFSTPKLFTSGDVFGVTVSMPKFYSLGDMNMECEMGQEELEEDVEKEEHVLYFKVSSIQGDNVYIDLSGISPFT